MNTILNNRLTVTRTLFALGAILISFALSNCGGSDAVPQPAAETDAQKAAKLLTAGQWSMTSVKVDGADKTSTYAGLKLTFAAAGGLSSANGRAIWPATASWEFTDDTGTSIKRNDGLIISVQDLTSTSLVLGLTWSKGTLGPGRAGSIAGQHVFTMGK